MTVDLSGVIGRDRVARERSLSPGLCRSTEQPYGRIRRQLLRLAAFHWSRAHGVLRHESMGIFRPCDGLQGRKGSQKWIRLFTAPYNGLADTLLFGIRSGSESERIALDKGRSATGALGFPRLVTAGLMSSSTGPGKTPARVTFSHLTLNNIGVVRKLNSVLFPVKYAEKYYKDILALEVEEFCQLGERAPLIALGKKGFCTSPAADGSNPNGHSVLQ